MSATNRGAVRSDQDYYPTPEKTISVILKRIKIDQIKTSCEPCRGNDNIYKFLPGERIWAELSQGVDYLTSPLPFVELIVTNPPFTLAIEFLTKSLTHGLTIVYLLRLNFLGSKKRKPFFELNRPTHLYVLSSRPSFTGSGTDATEYAWFVWDRGELMKDAPGIYVI